MKDRLVIPEILDSLPHSDPEAKRSRRDLRLVNFFMGNYRWLRHRMLASEVTKWVELGAGEGRLASAFGSDAGRLLVQGVDFAPRPEDWPETWNWSQGDLFEALAEPSEKAEGCAASLFIHHFEKSDLLRIGDLANERFVKILFSEPARFRVFRILAYLLFPFVNRVTRHDMQISIGAGFRGGELAGALGLSDDWEIKESVHWFGGFRFEAWREGE